MGKRKRSYTKYVVILGICFFTSVFYKVYAVDVVSEIFTSQTSSWLGSNNSQIQVNNNISYVNKGNNSSIIGNYFTGYYYDTILWFFKMDWSEDQSQNVRIISSTSACPVGYGYKFWGYAYSNTFGFIDFDYNSNVFVYYCMQDKKMRGYAYSTSLGFQNFSWISFDIETVGTNSGSVSGTWFFTNDTSNIQEVTTPVNQVWPNWQTVNSNFSANTIQTDTIEFEAQKESLFYIIK